MNPIISRYKIPFLIALIIGLVAVVFGVAADWVVAVWAFLGAFVGMILPDLEYIFDAYFIDSDSELAKEVKDLVKHKKISGYVNFLNTKEYKYQELSIHSALFTILIGVFALYTAFGTYWYFAKTLAVSMFAILIYQSVIELVKTKTLKRWFWFYKGDLTYKGYALYELTMVIFLIIIFTSL